MFVKIAEISSKEYQDALFVRKSVFVEEQQIPLEVEVDQNENQATHLVLYNDQEEPIAAGRYRVVDGLAKAERICVLASERGSGAGAQIMKALEQHAAEQGLDYVKLSAQAPAIPFYEKLGYHAITEEYLEQNIPHKMMKKELR